MRDRSQTRRRRRQPIGRSSVRRTRRGRGRRHRRPVHHKVRVGLCLLCLSDRTTRRQPRRSGENTLRQSAVASAILKSRHLSDLWACGRTRAEDKQLRRASTPQGARQRSRAPRRGPCPSSLCHQIRFIPLIMQGRDPDSGRTGLTRLPRLSRPSTSLPRSPTRQLSRSSRNRQSWDRTRVYRLFSALIRGRIQMCRCSSPWRDQRTCAGRCRTSTRSRVRSQKSPPICRGRRVIRA